jgi:hypothetical protein
MDKTMAAKVPITPLWRSMMLCNYSRRTPTEMLVEQARSIFHGVYDPQPFYVKLRFMLSAAAKPAFYRMLTTQVEHQTPASLFTVPVSKEQNGKAQRDNTLYQPGEAERKRMEQQSLEIERSVRELMEQMEADKKKTGGQTPQPPRRTRKQRTEAAADAPVQAQTAPQTPADKTDSPASASRRRRRQEKSSEES